jgi:hypothetical protein
MVAVDETTERGGV